MSQAVEIKSFLNRLGILYGPPETPDPKAFIREYEAMLVRYSPEIIRSAGDHIRDNHTRRSWPTPGEVREALMEVAPEPERVDWDSVEADRKEGWKFSDLTKSAATPESKARVQAMVDEMKRNFAANKIDTKEPVEIDWKRGQRDGFEEMQRTSPNQGLHRSRDL